MATLADALCYAKRGWRVVPIPHQGKNPGIVGWQRLHLLEEDLPQYFNGEGQNVGVLLGEPSRWLIDVDVDHELAVDLAAEHLPPTGAVFGRPSKPKSHWLYYATRPVATRQWRLPGTKRVIVELRSTGGQTVFPGSVHPSGESVRWDCAGEPAPIDPGELVAQLQALYSEVCKCLAVSPSQSDRGSLIARHCAPPSIVGRAARYLAELPPAVSGQGGHNATFHAACTLVLGFGLDREPALALLRQWNESCQPPWTDRELEHKVDDALKQPGWRGYLLADRSRLKPSLSGMAAIARATQHAIAHRRRALRRNLV